MRSNACVKCQGTMTRGFILQQTPGAHSAVAQWVEGEPVKSFWTGLKLRGRTKLTIETWRCGRCGFLESYAR